MKKLILMLFLVVGGVMNAAADDWYLRGDFNNWGTDNKFEEGQTTVTLRAGQIIHFKLTKGETWYGNNGTMKWHDSSNWDFSKDQGNCSLDVGDGGIYTFTLSDGPKLTVTYPGATIYLCNLREWSSPYVYILKSAYWNKENGSGCKENNNGILMTRIGSTNVWKANLPTKDVSSNVVFIKDLQDGYENFWQTEAIYKEDFSTSKAIFVPNINSPESFNGTTYYRSGEWHAYPTYTRAVTSGNFGTICLPFDATVEGAKVYKIVSKVGSGEGMTGINLETVNTLEAGKAYIYKATASTLTATYSGSYTAATDANGMLGNLSSGSITAPVGSFVVSGNQIHEVAAGDGVKVGQYKAYITLTGVDVAGDGARADLFLGFDDEITGIETVKEGTVDNAVFNLQGQRVMNAQKGLYIVNGKKMLMK